MDIKNVHFAKGFSAYYFDDQAAIKRGAEHDGFTYSGQAVTPGFSAVRQAGECVSIILELDNGDIAVGDCVAVQYSGAGGRDPLFSANAFIPYLETHVRPLLAGRNVSVFTDAARSFDDLTIAGAPLHAAIRYGVSQALLEATARATGRMRVEVLCDEYGLPKVAERIPLFGQSGDDRRNAVDKMILKNVDALPHGLINNIPEKLGTHGERLAEYIEWIAARVRKLRRDPAYSPKIHIDVYGTIGLIFDNDPDAIADYLLALGRCAEPFSLSIEGPVDAGEKTQQIDLLAAIKTILDRHEENVKIVADEWCNTFEDIVDFVDAKCCHTVQIKTPDLGGLQNSLDAVLYCKKNGVDAYQGGTCNETDVSARACTHVALAGRPDLLLVKPGMGFDEGMTIVANEMSRTIALMKARTA